jgi:hypothetical protein
MPLRDTWKNAKVAHKETAEWLKQDKKGFGKLLDTYEQKLTLYHAVEAQHATHPDQTAQNAAKKAVKDAAQAASKAGISYKAELTTLEKTATGDQKVAVKALKTVIDAIQSGLVDAMAGNLG